ncbi:MULTISPECIES: family 16 glycoside hydrolase [unclassified Leeuwenhoekiella]|uniref:family 16 glycoside hydrolase n=1 Tax=unclassified Leeuwenhoekiella TaxID=2615029 RepID=UPI0025BBFE70|nr:MULTISPECIES: family 16 glycoside hydrolase [unclassified Leeuwenhoekiella]
MLEFVPWSKEWQQKKQSGKWDNAPDYGKYKTGYIGLQDHSSPIWFRNIKIKSL